MFKATTWILVFLLATIAGCLGDEESPSTSGSADTSDNDSGSGNSTGDGADVSGNATIGDNNTTSDRVNGTWHFDNRTGSVSGAALVVTGPSEEERFDVAPGTLSFAVDVGADGTALSVSILPPGCEEESCADASGSTASGNVTFEASEPAEGTWTVLLQPASPGIADADYEASIAFLLPEV